MKRNYGVILAVMFGSAVVAHAEESAEAPMAEEPSAAMTEESPAESPAVETEAVRGKVARAQLTTDIQNREPVDNLGESVVAVGQGVYKLYYFTDLRDFGGKTVIHRWQKGDEVMADVPFKVGGDHWRVYSSKNFNQYMAGDWSVSVVVDGQVIHTNKFTLKW